MIAADAITTGAAPAAAWEHLIVGIPAGRTRRALGAVAGVTGVAVPTLNGVWVYGREAERDAVVDLLDRVSGTGAPHCLQLSPRSGGELRALAQARGMRLDAEIPLMTLSGPPDSPAQDHGHLVIEILDSEQAAVHAEIAAAGFQAPVEASVGLMTPEALEIPGVRTYLGKVDGEPVATGVGVCLQNHVGIFNVATLPAHRRRGYGAAITDRAVRDALDARAQWAWLQSTADGYRVYEKLGFRTLESWECWIAA